MAIQVLNMFISVLQAAISLFFNMEIAPGISLGWIFIVAVLMLVLIKYFLKGDNNG